MILNPDFLIRSFQVFLNKREMLTPELAHKVEHIINRLEQQSSAEFRTLTLHAVASNHENQPMVDVLVSEMRELFFQLYHVAKQTEDYDLLQAANQIRGELGMSTSLPEDDN